MDTAFKQAYKKNLKLITKKRFYSNLPADSQITQLPPLQKKIAKKTSRK
jgi:hypothetical protein